MQVDFISHYLIILSQYLSPHRTKARYPHAPNHSNRPVKGTAHKSRHADLFFLLYLLILFILHLNYPSLTILNFNSLLLKNIIWCTIWCTFYSLYLSGSYKYRLIKGLTKKALYPPVYRVFRWWS